MLDTHEIGTSRPEKTNYCGCAVNAVGTAIRAHSPFLFLIEEALKLFSEKEKQEKIFCLAIIEHTREGSSNAARSLKNVYFSCFAPLVDDPDIVFANITEKVATEIGDVIKKNVLKNCFSRIEEKNVICTRCSLGSFYHNWRLMPIFLKKKDDLQFCNNPSDPFFAKTNEFSLSDCVRQYSSLGLCTFWCWKCGNMKSHWVRKSFSLLPIMLTFKILRGSSRKYEENGVFHRIGIPSSLLFLEHDDCNFYCMPDNRESPAQSKNNVLEKTRKREDHREGAGPDEESSCCNASFSPMEQGTERFVCPDVACEELDRILDIGSKLPCNGNVSLSKIVDGGTMNSNQVPTSWISPGSSTRKRNEGTRRNLKFLVNCPRKNPFQRECTSDTSPGKRQVLLTQGEKRVVISKDKRRRKAQKRTKNEYASNGSGIVENFEVKSGIPRLVLKGMEAGLYSEISPNPQCSSSYPPSLESSESEEMYHERHVHAGSPNSTRTTSSSERTLSDTETSDEALVDEVREAKRAASAKDQVRYIAHAVVRVARRDSGRRHFVVDVRNSDGSWLCYDDGCVKVGDFQKEREQDSELLIYCRSE